MPVDGGHAIVLLLIPAILVGYVARKINVALLIIWMVSNWSALLALYAGLAFRYLGVDPFEIELETLVIINFMTVGPLLVVAGLCYIFPTCFINREQLSIEWKQIEERVKSGGQVVICLYMIFFGYMLFDVINSGLYFRDYYISKVLANNAGILGLYNSIAVLAFCVSLLKRKFLFALTVALFFVILGKKHPILSCILIPILWSIVYQDLKVYKYTNVVAVAVLLFYAMTQLYSSLDSVPFLLQLASSFDYVHNFNYFIENYAFGIDGGEILATSLYKYIPRMFWESKPTSYGFLLIHEKLFPNEIALGFFPSVYEGFAVWIADFGYMGIILYIFLNSIIISMMSSKKLGAWIRYIMLAWIVDPLIAICILLADFTKKIIARYKYNNG